MENNDKFQEHLVAIYKNEAKDHIESITTNTIALKTTEDRSDKQACIEQVYRELHSLKGASRAVGFSLMERVCQGLESLFSRVQKGSVKLGSEEYDFIVETADNMHDILEAFDSSNRDLESPVLEKQLKRINTLGEAKDPMFERDARQEKQSADEFEENSTDEMLQAQVEQSVDSPDEEGVAEQSIEAEVASERVREPVEEVSTQSEMLSSNKSASDDVVRVSAQRLTAVLLESEEMLSAKLSAITNAGTLRAIRASSSEWEKEWGKIQPALHRVEQAAKRHNMQSDSRISIKRELDRIIDFLYWNGEFMKSVDKKLGDITHNMDRDNLQLSNMVDNLLDDMKHVMMFPFSSMLQIMPRIVRDISREKGIVVDLEINGGDIEIDRRILEDMKDPFIHLIRNSLDHGIESPAERKAAGKPEKGKITIDISPKDNNVEVRISDDGGGIHISKLKSTLLMNKEATKAEIDGFSDEQLLMSIFRSGISTSPIITEISGRGLGLAIVHEQVENLGGAIQIVSEEGVGTTFIIQLPLTVATFRGILARVSGRFFVFPTMYIERVVRFQDHEVVTVGNLETIRVDQQTLSLVRMADVLGLPKSATQNRSQCEAFIVRINDQRIAFWVDEVISEQEVLFKKLGEQLIRVRNIAGATIMGSGTPIPIINMKDIMKTALGLKKIAQSQTTPESQENASTQIGKKAVIAEDSITTRLLLKNILETAGYTVSAAVDGFEAYNILRNEPADIVVSDVDMPRMSGFELTAKIRDDDMLKDTPVVLVTALSTDEDKRKGIEAGANAYIVKSSFEQGKLLEVMERLL